MGYPFFHWGSFIYWFMTAKYGIGPGDNCFMVGRFIRLGAQKQFDSPVLRFGNLATMPEKIWQDKRGFDQESFLVDMRSLSGFSRSAVVLYLLNIDLRWKREEIEPQSAPPIGFKPSDVMNQSWLLGIDWGHLPVTLKTYEPGPGPKVETGTVEANSGTAAVVPAWKIAELLDGSKGDRTLVTARKRAEEEFKANHEGAAVLDSAQPSS